MSRATPMPRLRRAMVSMMTLGGAVILMAATCVAALVCEADLIGALAAGSVLLASASLLTSGDRA